MLSFKTKSIKLKFYNPKNIYFNNKVIYKAFQLVVQTFQSKNLKTL